MIKRSFYLKYLFHGIAILAVSVTMYFLSRYHYLLFHLIAETYSIIIACGIFIVSWNTRRQSTNKGLVVLGIAYIFVATLDFFHTISYHGMNIFDNEIYYANQIWICARTLETLGILVFVYGGQTKRTPRVIVAALLYGGITAASLFSIFVAKIFPPCFIEGQGQTPFKIYSEYLICLLMGIALLHMIRLRKQYDHTLFLQFIGSISLTILSEISFTLYTDNYGLLNVVGHLLKIISFYLVYRSVIVNTLERPYDTLFRELKTSETQLREEIATRERFFRIVAHDLKNSFNSLLGFSELLVEQTKASGNQTLFEYAGFVNEATQTNYRFMENLLNWARLRTGHAAFDPVECDLHELAHEVCMLKKVLATPKSITLKNLVPQQTIIFADAEMIKTLLRNLLSNAIKFSYPGSCVEIDSFLQNEEIHVCVQDHGIGITPEALPALFNIDSKYTRSGTAGETGTGIGLILCRELVEKHGGTLYAKSEPGSGARICFTLPIRIQHDV